MELKVNLNENSYPIYIEKGILNNIEKYIGEVIKEGKIVIISDDNVFPLYGQAMMKNLSCYEVHSIVLPHGEQSKSFDQLQSIYQKLLSFQVSRTDLIIALGGGVIGDLAGFVASTFLRGLKFVQVPTTLLAQVDSSVGGKVAVDLPEGKNLVGAFKHPSLVLIDPLTLQTLEPRFINDGMGEVIKYGCIFDKNLFEQLSNYQSFDELYQDIDDIIYTCVDLKRDVVEKDLFDFGERLKLNFGHTLGHAVEQYYQFEHYSHGEAVSIGMVQLTRIAELRDLTQKGTADKIAEVCQKYHLPINANVHTHNLKQAILLDKKNINKSLNYVLLHEIGDSYIYKSDLSLIETLEEI